MGIVIYLSSPIKREVLTAAIYWTKNTNVWNEGTRGLRPITGANEIVMDTTWNYLKLVIDWNKRVYKRLITGFLDLDLTSLLLHAVQPSITAAPWMTQGGFEVIVGFRLNEGTRGYIDDVRLYVNEE